MNPVLVWTLMLLVLTMPLPARAAVWIRDFQGEPTEYRLERNGQPLPVQYYQTLQPGDRLWVETHRVLRLEFDDGSVVAVKPADSPYTVQDTGAAPGVLANLIAWAGDWLQTHAETTASLVTRSDGATIALPLIPAPPARLEAGTRALSLAWSGGKPPFHVSLERQADKIVALNEPGVTLERFSSPPLDLIPGLYELTILDGRGAKTVASIEVVTAAELPAAPGELAAAAGADSLKATVHALWLAAQGESWLLEAYQRISPWREQHEPARWLMDSLEKGIRPPPPGQAVQDGG